MYVDRSFIFRTLSDEYCEPVKECPEGEEAYFNTHPDVASIWKPRSAYSHWRQFGEAEGRVYLCKCPKAEDRDKSVPEEQNNRSEEKHGLSAIKAIVTGLEHSGTTLTGFLLNNAPCVMGAFETGWLLADTPAEIETLDPWIVWHNATGTNFDVPDQMYNLANEHLHEMKQARDFDDLYDILRRTSHIFNNMIDAEYCPKPSLVIDKAPRYVYPEYFEKILIKTPNTPVIVLKKEYDILKKSWARRGDILDEEFYNATFDNVSEMMKKYPGRIILIDYIEMMKDPSSVMKDVFSFVGLVWDETYLRMENLKRKYGRYGPSMQEEFDPWVVTS